MSTVDIADYDLWTTQLWKWFRTQLLTMKFVFLFREKYYGICRRQRSSSLLLFLVLINCLPHNGCTVSFHVAPLSFLQWCDCINIDCGFLFACSVYLGWNKFEACRVNSHIGSGLAYEISFFFLFLSAPLKNANLFAVCVTKTSLFNGVTNA